MKRGVSLILVLVLMLMPCSYAWKTVTHYDAAEAIYEKLPSSKRSKININAMIDGSNDPDEKFHDTVRHSFPRSFTEAKKWLDRGRSAYRSKNYRYASYCFGVASHYITDTFSAPHCVSGESSTLHNSYEKQATYLAPSISYVSGDIYSLMQRGYLNGRSDWSRWTKTKSSSIVQRDLNMGTSVAYRAINLAMN
ncbi:MULTISPECIES: zinc dependent phospholipase C family protein [Methanothermobacter]|uniref:Phospholipase C/D domain-containing protein n=1 Tax=Methanothermobacter marburgensis (strain ATCC BAA-927 / DSM 2133 / JCM 14651 / NBRC 100331 / OCM 82 / Marburg) TaxID=79929 RepID=D9PV91_METTM|nr:MULTISPECIES: zinc dependent phospholipase C family protein [Methanothermobacter]ADL58139.1 conserved hypothetical protein [Methanothermobacter marburgensis str. Marburg]MCG2829000.1 zinc dependent phospholipase C family protein [Methanothermobacter sp. K4]QEF94007.1 zinc dependent phospholipase C family protein [Methanothermobacter sp. KEPCO-1]QHN08564.1 zinc dependent phospholipase C family protein [Methanothermobacter sp. THM-2]WBF10318.1 zinc dependent phospholipase C family protein [Me